MAAQRLFAAVSPPRSVTAELSARAAALAALPGADRLRWSRPEDWHCTLAFYGAVDEETVPELGRALARAAARRSPFTLALAAGGRFGERVLWAALDGDLAALTALAADARAAGRSAGAPADERYRYRPHLTLARARREGGAALSRCVEELRQFRSRPWRVTEAVLLRSRPPHAGAAGDRPAYERVGAWPLGG